jgi:hypothetical protein
MGRWSMAIGPLVLKQSHERIVKLLRKKGATTWRRTRVDTTVVETNIHYPTDNTFAARASSSGYWRSAQTWPSGRSVVIGACQE